MVETPDPLHGWSDAGEYWTTSNIGEAAPGVQTPLSATIWWPAIEDCVRETGYRAGYLTTEERRTPAEMGRRFLRMFYGRCALNIEVMSVVGDRVPGTTGPAVVEGIFGRVPDDMAFSPTRRHYLRVITRLPRIHRAVPRELVATAPRFTSWWRESTARVPDLDRGATTALLTQALTRFHEALLLQHLAVIGVIQPSLAMLDVAARRSGVPEVTELGTASGNAEMAVVCDLWRASRGQLGLDQVVANHGFHAPLEGELSTRVWREDDLALRRMVEQYSLLGDEDDPLRGDAARATEHEAIARRAVAGVPWWQRRLVRGMIALARRNMPLRGIAKCSYLQGFDVIRACSRRLGELLAADGLIEHADDVFYLTMPELTGQLPAGARELISRRRARRAEYQQVTIPGDWQGMPPTQPARTSDDLPSDARVDRVTGIGVSAGVVEGRVRVVLEPDFTSIEPGEVLVAPTTDPSWSSIMFISAALVVDIGGLLSHAAVVAREMGVPCVANTRTGTRSLRTGDLVRVDGGSGVVIVLEPCVAP